jgi:hypothetical protein
MPLMAGGQTIQGAMQPPPSGNAAFAVMQRAVDESFQWAESHFVRAMWQAEAGTAIGANVKLNSPRLLPFKMKALSPSVHYVFLQFWLCHFGDFRCDPKSHCAGEIGASWYLIEKLVVAE